MNERIYNPICYEGLENGRDCGVYQIRNKINGKVYVGSSKVLSTRKSQHFNKLRQHKHLNSHLQAAFDKYGENNFVFEIIEYCEETSRFEVEQYWIDFFIGKNCYNINPKASNPPSTLGKKRTFSEEHRRNMSIAMKKKFSDPKEREKLSTDRIGKNRGKDHVNAKAVVHLETQEVYGSIGEAERITGFNHRSISACCKGKVKSVNGTHWMYKTEYDKMSIDEIEILVLKKGNGKPVVCLETLKVYKKVIDASKDSGCERNTIIDCCENRMVESKGIHWVYFEDFKKMSPQIIQAKLEEHSTAFKRCKCLETQQVFRSITEAARTLKVCPSKITAVCRGYRKTTGGFHFKYL